MTKLNENEDIVASVNDKYISFVDVRTNGKTIDYNITKPARTLISLSQNSVFYGCMDGEVGVVDLRKNTERCWRSGAIQSQDL